MARAVHQTEQLCTVASQDRLKWFIFQIYKAPGTDSISGHNTRIKNDA